MYKSFVGAALGIVMGSSASAENLPPLNTPSYRANCSTGELVAEFAFCSVRMVPVMTMMIDGVPVMGMMSPRPVCSLMRTRSEEGLDNLQPHIPGDPEHVKFVTEMARKDLQDPLSACPALAGS